MSWKNFLAYYGFLLLVLVSWSNPDALPPLPLRLAFLVAVLAPVLFSKKMMLPIVLFTFIVISTAGYAVSYMPVDGLFVSIIVIASILLSRSYLVPGITMPSVLVFLMGLTLFMDVLLSDRIYSAYSFLILLLVGRKMIARNNPEIVHWIAWSFVVISAVLSLEFLIMGDLFAQEYVVGDDSFIRKGWADPNYFGCELGLGVLAALIELLTNRQLPKWVKRFLYCSLFIGIFTIVTTASRGAVLALCGGVLCVIFFSHIKASVKLYALLGMLALVGFLFYSDSTDLLIARFVNDAGDAGGRTEIWKIKFYAFENSANVFEWLFGIGRQAAIDIGMHEGFHNDYVAFLVEYGALGFIGFITMLLYPVFYMSPTSRGPVLACVFYVMLVCCSLEPITSGYLAYFYFYLYILLLVRPPKLTPINNRYGIYASKI